MKNVPNTGVSANEFTSALNSFQEKLNKSFEEIPKVKTVDEFENSVISRILITALNNINFSTGLIFRAYFLMQYLRSKDILSSEDVLIFDTYLDKNPIEYKNRTDDFYDSKSKEAFKNWCLKHIELTKKP